MEVPDGICGFELSPEDLDRDDWLSQEELRQEVGTASCWRDTWRDHERCIWHADVAEKPAEELTEARRDGWDEGSPLGGSEIEEWENLDGAVLKGVEFGDDIDFSRCTLFASELKEVNLYGATLHDADLRHAELHDAYLWDAELHDADLSSAELHDGYLGDAELHDAILWHAELHDAILWHAELHDAYLSSAELHDADLSSAELHDADLSSAELHDADLRHAELHDADLRHAELHDAILWHAELHDADFRHAELDGAIAPKTHFSNTDLTDANLEQADLGDAEIHWSNLENADLTRANLDGTTFGDVRLYKTRLQDVFLSDQTTFRKRCWYDYRTDPLDVPESVLLHPLDELEWNVLSPDLESVRITNEDHNIEVAEPSETRTEWLRSFFSRWLALFKTNDGDDSDRVDNYETARSVYRTRERIHRENSLPEEVGPEYVKAKWTQHRKALAENDWWSYVDLATRRWSMQYGEGPWRLVYASIAVIFGFGLLYPLFGGVQLSQASGPVIDLVSPLDLSLAAEPLGGLLASLYFSAVTFTTLGYGDIQPHGIGAQVLAGVESFAGAIMIALFVAVVARNKMR